MKTKKKSYHHGDLKKSLIEASIEILKTEGYKSLSLRKVAKMANVSQTAPYRHYSDLEALIADVAIAGFLLLKEELIRAKNKYKNHPLLQYRESGVQYVLFANNNPDIFQIMYGNQITDHSKYPELLKAESDTFQVLVDIITNCQDKKILNISNTKKAAMSSWTLVHGIAVLLIGKQVMFKNLKTQDIRKTTKELIENLYIGMKNNHLK